MSESLVRRKKRKKIPLQPMTSAKGSTGPALISEDPLATPVPVVAWALAKMRSRRRETDGFPVGGLTTN